MRVVPCRPLLRTETHVPTVKHRTARTCHSLDVLPVNPIARQASTTVLQLTVGVVGPHSGTCALARGRLVRDLTDTKVWYAPCLHTARA